MSLNRIKAFIQRLRDDVRGQDATEYALLMVLLALAVTGGMTLIATGLNNSMQDTSVTLTTAAGS